jgi:hypothetical protein
VTVTALEGPTSHTERHRSSRFLTIKAPGECLTFLIARKLPESGVLRQYAPAGRPVIGRAVSEQILANAGSAN